jgi:hypothetical protein
MYRVKEDGTTVNYFHLQEALNDIVTEALKSTDVDVACSAHSPSYLEHSVEKR